MSDFVKLLNENKILLNRAINLDNEKWGQDKSFNDLFENKIENIELESKKSYLVIYEGEIEYTKKICEEAINSDANVIFILNDEYLATNKTIIRISEKLLNNNFIKLYNNTDDSRVIKNTSEVDEVIFIGSLFDYKNIKDDIKCRCKFIEIEE